MDITRTELKNMLWKIGQTKTANALNITMSKLLVVCADYDIPLPPREYWYGKTKEIPLPNPEQDVLVCLEKKPNPILGKIQKHQELLSKPIIPNLADCFPYYNEAEQAKLQAAFDALKMESELSETPHAEITKYWAYQDSGKGLKKFQPTLKFKTSLREIDSVVFIFIDQLFKAFESVGARIYSDSEATKIEFGDITFAIKFKLPSFKNNLRENVVTRNGIVAANAATNDEPLYIWKDMIIMEMNITGPTGHLKSHKITPHPDESFNMLLKRMFVEVVEIAGKARGVDNERLGKDK